jgi:GT2 family glycosyltransferase/glycosyltransferase involved in cell wall biosynthesis
MRAILSKCWRALSWPVRHRRLPSRAELRRFIRKVRGEQPPAPPPLPAPAQPATEPALRLPAPLDPYQVWLANNRWNQRSLAAAQHALAALPRQPLVSVLLTVRDFNPASFETTVASVRAQVYPRWELCVIDSSSTSPAVRPMLRRLSQADPRIKIAFLDQPAAENAIARLAQGEFLVFLHQENTIEPDYLLELAEVFVTRPECDVAYADEDHLDADGSRRDPEFKPDWSPELLLSCMYLGHAFAVRRALFDEVGGFRDDFAEVATYDLALRVTERARRIVHVPRVLYHSRARPSRPPSEQGVRAAQEALQRRGIAGQVSRDERASARGLDHHQIDFPDTGGRVAIVIPTRNRVELLRRCVESIRARTAYDNYEIVILDNESDDPDTLAYLDGLASSCRVLRLASPPQPSEPAAQAAAGSRGRFNYAWLNNEGVRRLDSEYVLFLNNDTEVRSREWLSQLVGFAQIAGVGAVGARLLFPDGRVQHAGIITGPYGGMCSAAFRLLPEGDDGYLHYPRLARDYSAVTAACMLMRRELFLRVGGFDEERFAVAYNDVDLGLRLREQGLRSVYAPRAELFHYEGASRGRYNDNPRETLAYRRAWGNDRDPYYNPNLSLENERFDVGTRRTDISLAPEQFPIRLLLCAPNLDRDGPGLNLLELAQGLRERGRFAPEVYSPAEGALAAAYRDAGVPVHCFRDPLSGSAGDVASIQEHTAAFAEWTYQQRFGAVYANTLTTFWAIHAAHRRGIASVWNVPDCVDWRHYFGQWGHGFVQVGADAFAYSYHLMFASHATRGLFHELNTRHNHSVICGGLRPDPAQQVVAGHGRSAARWRGGFPAAKTVVSVIAPVCERNRQHDFARAAVELLRRGRRDVFFAVVGCRPGAYQDGLEALVRPHADHFALVPETAEALHYLRASDVLVCCSAAAGYPRTTLEAMTLGVPVVAASAFGIAEQVQHGVSALLYPPGDVAALTEQLQRLVRAPEERLRLAESAALALENLPTYEEHLKNVERLLLEAFLAAGEDAAAEAAARRAA